MRQLDLVEEEQAGVVEEQEAEQQQPGGDALGDKSSVPLVLENISSLLKRQPGLARLEQRLPSNGRPGRQSDSLHRAVLTHRDNELSQRRLSDHFDLVLASHKGAATDLVSNVFHLLCHKRGESGQPSWSDQREGGGDDPTCQ